MIIFTNNKSREYRWHMVIAALAVVSMVATAAAAFYPASPAQTIPNAQKPELDLKIFDSDAAKSLEPFPALTVQGIKAGRGEPFLIYYQPPQQAQNSQ